MQSRALSSSDSKTPYSSGVTLIVIFFSIVGVVLSVINVSYLSAKLRKKTDMCKHIALICVNIFLIYVNTFRCLASG